MLELYAGNVFAIAILHHNCWQQSLVSNYSVNSCWILHLVADQQAHKYQPRRVSVHSSDWKIWTSALYLITLNDEFNGSLTLSLENFILLSITCWLKSAQIDTNQSSGCMVKYRLQWVGLCTHWSLSSNSGADTNSHTCLPQCRFDLQKLQERERAHKSFELLGKVELRSQVLLLSLPWQKWVSKMCACGLVNMS